MVCHCLILETARGLVLVDTGFGAADVALPRQLPAPFRALFRPELAPADTAVAHLRRLGLDPRDVRHIVVTHLDLDHAGGIADFPEATVHVHALEKRAASHPATFGERRRYVRAQFADHERWALYGDREGDAWLGLQALRPLEDLGADVALVPLHGHSRGHSGVLVGTGGGWLLHAGDAYFHEDELAEPPRAPAGLAAFQRLVAVDDAARRSNQQRLRALHRDHRDRVAIFCAHDTAELERLGACRA